MSNAGCHRASRPFNHPLITPENSRFELKSDVRNLVLFNLAIDSQLRGCDLVRLKVGDVASGGYVKPRGVIIQRKTGRLVQSEITRNAR